MIALEIRQDTSQLNQNSDIVRANAELDNAQHTVFRGSSPGRGR